jgi:large subunit ribosomal protein L24
MKKIKKWDTVKIISGKNKKMTGIVEKTLEDAVVVQWVNLVKRAVKWKGFVEKTHPIHISNVMYFDTETSQASKIKIVEDKNGKRKRQIAKTGRILEK